MSLERCHYPQGRERAGREEREADCGGHTSCLTLVTVVVLSHPSIYSPQVRKRAQKELGEPAGSRQSWAPMPLPQTTSLSQAVCVE